MSYDSMIRVGHCGLRSYPDGWVYGRLKTRKSTDELVDEISSSESLYTSSPVKALDGILEILTRDADPGSLDELVAARSAALSLVRSAHQSITDMGSTE